jgi:hypothetical protein
MNGQQVLMEKREEARQAILTLEDKTPTAIILNLFGRWFPKSISKQSLLYWVLQIVLISAVVILPGSLLSLALGEMGKWSRLFFRLITAYGLVFFGFILAHTAFRLTFDELANHTVLKIANIEDCSALVAFCRSSASSMYVFLVAGSLLWSVWGVVSVKEFPGIGLMYMVILAGCLVGVSYQAVFWVITLTNQLKDFQYELNTFTPANSEVVVRLSSMLNMIIYLTGSFFVVLTLYVSILGSQMSKAFAGPLTLLGCGIILVQFFTHRSTIGGIIEKERWMSLNKLQLQMNTIQATEDLSNTDVSERLLRLADLHERILVDHSGGFDFKSLLSLFSQLLLPLLGLLLGNIDKLMNLIMSLTPKK